jgi:hypothetical protein
LNYVEIEGGRAWLFVTEKMHKEEGEMGEGKGRVDRQIIN